MQIRTVRNTRKRTPLRSLQMEMEKRSHFELPAVGSKNAKKKRNAKWFALGGEAPKGPVGTGAGAGSNLSSIQLHAYPPTPRTSSFRLRRAAGTYWTTPAYAPPHSPGTYPAPAATNLHPQQPALPGGALHPGCLSQISPPRAGLHHPPHL